MASHELPDWRFLLIKNTHLRIYRFRFKKMKPNPLRKGTGENFTLDVKMESLNL